MKKKDLKAKNYRDSVKDTSKSVKKADRVKRREALKRIATLTVGGITGSMIYAACKDDPVSAYGDYSSYSSYSNYSSYNSYSSYSSYNDYSSYNSYNDYSVYSRYAEYSNYYNYYYNYYVVSW